MSRVHSAFPGSPGTREYDELIVGSIVDQEGFPEGDQAHVTLTEPARILEENLHLIEETIGAICRKKSIFGEDAREFASEVKLRLCEDGYRRIRLFEGKSSFQTYMYTVITRIYLDYVRKNVPRWRPSETAAGFGPSGIRFEELLVREKHGFDDAYRILTINFGLSFDIDDACRLAGLLRKRAASEFTEVRAGEDTLNAVPSDSVPQDERVIAGECREKKKEILAVMERIQGMLSPEDRLLLRMKFADNAMVSEIARLLRRERSWVDRRIREILLVLRKEILAAPGIDEHAVIDILRVSDEAGELYVA